MPTKYSTKTIDGRVHVVGGGLAGSECALQLANRGHKVVLYEMRPQVSTPAHKTSMFAELVCSNSFGSLSEPSAPAQLKWEMEKLGSIILKTAKKNSVPAGQALGIDRNLFAQEITNLISNHPNIEISKKEVQSLFDLPRPAVIATGPLTSPELCQSLADHFGTDFLYFYDSIAPVIAAESIDMEICFKASRYDKGTADYINCPMNKEEYFKLVHEIDKAEKVIPKNFESANYFESCLPVEVMVERGPLTLAFGPCKPKGLIDPKTGKSPFAAVQLRQENSYGTAYNMVGFQTKMTYPEQKRVLRMIPGLQNAEFLKLGSIHRNMFINSPKLLTSTLSSKYDPLLFFAGQITGVEGYFESTSIGMLVGLIVDSFLKDKPFAPPNPLTAIGSLWHSIVGEQKENFQPTNINWGLFPQIELPKGEDRKVAQTKRARENFPGSQLLICDGIQS